MSNVNERLSAALADRYRLEHELGAGGMATVYLAEDLKHHRNVAIKVLKPELAAVLGAERFVQEIQTTAALSHPHILPLFDSGEAGGFLYYVMPFIEGETIREKLNRETQFGIEEAVRITTEVADALDYAHRHGVIHRDIKPENILLHDGRAMVMDFGIALAVSAAAGGRMTETGLSLGTPHYMSPEQATAEKEITGRSDIYSLASVLYEMLAGVPPHEGGSAQQTIMRIITETPKPVQELRRSVPPNVASALGKALEKLPADRFESAKDFSAALTNPSFGAALRPAGLGQASAGAHRSFGLRTVALIAAATLMLGVAGTKVLWRTGADAGRTTRLMLAFPANQQPRYSSSGTYPVVTQARDGSGLYYWGPGATTRAQLLFRSWDELSARRLAHTIDDGCCDVLSPNGDSIAYLIGPHALQVAPVVGGIPRTVADSGLTSVTDFGGGVDWASDGSLYASGLGGLVRVSPQGGRPELVARLDTVRGDLRYLWPSVLPGSNAALVTVIPAREPDDPTRAAIGVADFTTGKVDVLLQGLRAVYAPTGHLIVAKPDGVLWAVPFDPRSRRVTGRARELSDTASATNQTVDMSLSPSGTLAYTRGIVETYQLVWVDRSGDVRPVAGDLSGSDVSDPALSPDGRYLAVSIAGADLKYDIWVKALNGAPKARLTFDAGIDQRPAWRPGTGAVSFNSSRENPGAGLLLYERNVDGSGNTRKLDLGDPRTIGGATWSPDGKWLVIRTNDQEAGNADILAIRPGLDSVARPLVASPAEELAPAVSPDGRWLAYSSNESGRREVWVRPFPNTGSAQYQVSADGGTVPLWSHDGRELFFIDAASNMVSVPVIPGPGFQHGQPQILFSAASFKLNPFFHQYDVTPDGKRFVMVRAESDATVHVVVVFNFLAELKRLEAGQ